MVAKFFDLKRILLIEDDYFQAQALKILLEAEGAQVIGPIGWLDEAMEFVARPELEVDLAILDIDLHGEPTYALADALSSRAVRCVFATGFGEDAVAEVFRKYPRCQKPYTVAELARALAKA